jgi:AraC-like DNA-binding protein
MTLPDSGDNSLSHLGFQSFLPSENLSSVIDSYWFIDNDNIVSTEHLHPDGGIGIILNYGDALEFDGHLNRDTCILDGTNTVAKRVKFKGMLKAIGIRFKPAGANLFFSSPLSEIKNESICLSDATFMKYSDLYSRLGKSKTLYEKVSVIEEWLCRSAQSEKRISNAVDKSLMLIRRHNGLLPIQSVAEQIGYHQRKIERLFNSQVGMTPKEYSQNLRIEQARKKIKSGVDCSFAMIADELGYFDQAHFIKQFKKIEGITPREYLLKFISRKQD